MFRFLSCALRFALVLGLVAAPAVFAGNTKDINSPVIGNVYGGNNNNIGESADNNTVNVNSGGTVRGEVHGGHAYGIGGRTPGADNNTVNVINGGAVTGEIYGGHGYGIGSAWADGNTVKINGGTVEGRVYGGYAGPRTPNHPELVGSARAVGNIVEIGGGTESDGPVYVGTVNSVVYGGYAFINGGFGSAAAEGNTVRVNSGGRAESDVYGGYAYINGGSGSATASGNSVEINGGTVNSVTGNDWVGNVFGGYAFIAGGSGSARADGNSITISGGTVLGNVFGGRASSPGPATATSNTVTISGNPTFDSYSGIFGGDGGSTSTWDGRSGNTLNLYSPITVLEVSNFENWNFYLPSTLTAGQTMLTIVSQADPYYGIADLGANAKVNVGIAGSSSPLRKGDTVTLIDASQGRLTGTLADSTANGQGMQGVTLLYEFNLMIENNRLLAEVADLGINPQAKALSEGGISGMTLITQGADLAAGQGMSNAVSAAARAGQGVGGPSLAGFGAVSAGQSRYNTGSHVDVAGFSLLAGLSWGVDTLPGRLTLGAFAEYGRGSYDTYNSFSNAAPVHGRGESYHVGGGILGRMDFSNTGPGRIYVEASGRAGGIQNEYRSSDLRDARGRKTEYDSSSSYYGFHVGTGYVWDITDDVSLDLYGKYFWTRQAGTSVTLSTGDSVKFKDTDSSRLRFGGRLGYAVNDYVSPYIGAAWEHEFDGKAEATSNGFALEAPSLRGDTGIGEIGFTVQPSKDLPLSFDVGVQGYTGKREGVTGSLQIKWEF